MRNAKYEMRHIPLYTPNMNQSEPSTSLKSSAAIFPVEVLRNILWFLSSVDLWPLRLVDKLLYENVMELLVRRIEYAFAKGGLVLKFEAYAQHPSTNNISLLCTFLHIDPKTRTTYFEFSGPTPEYGVIPTMPCSLLSRTLFLPAPSQVIIATTDILRVRPDMGSILQVFPVDEVEFAVSVGEAGQHVQAQLDRPRSSSWLRNVWNKDSRVTLRKRNGVIEIETVRQMTDEEALKQGLGETAGLKVEFKGVGLRAEYLLELLESDRFIAVRSGLWK